MYRTKWSGTVPAMHHITERITAAMERDGLSLTRLAEASAMPRMTLARRMNDPTTFKLGELERVASAVGTTADALVASKVGDRKRRNAA